MHDTSTIDGSIYIYIYIYTCTEDVNNVNLWCANVIDWSLLILSKSIGLSSSSLIIVPTIYIHGIAWMISYYYLHG